MPDPDVGLIQIWQGSVDNIPEGWLLCDGTNGTPNLRNRFIIGTGPGTPVGQTGGTTEHTHSFSSFGHTHRLGAIGQVLSFHHMDRDVPSEIITGTTDPSDHRPLYYSLCFIYYKGIN